MGAGEKKVFTLAQVFQHSSREDCWLLIGGRVTFLPLPALCPFIYFVSPFIRPRHKVKDEGRWWGNRVYDLTKFLEEHPGGSDILLSVTGKDATVDFEDVGHSPGARNMMEQYYVGDIDDSSTPVKRADTPPKPNNQDKTAEFIVKILQFLIPLAILGLAFGIHFYSKST
ncbi:hypothetical protein CDL15_Pgr026394 [Punica granatum]|uniref:Cytochrome b5 heme-binding domain-containing protein n=1 Tax=Punica granatum TaxID=22663 RepID=A0A218XQG4_PUNGR|nr:hypothetical protein CDL15_Pgr026394 [Punica granatum]